MDIYCKDCRFYHKDKHECFNLNNLIMVCGTGKQHSIISPSILNKHRDCVWYENEDIYYQSLSDSISKGF